MEHKKKKPSRSEKTAGICQKNRQIRRELEKENHRKIKKNEEKND